jgi:hypothetical protein
MSRLATRKFPRALPWAGNWRNWRNWKASEGVEICTMLTAAPVLPVGYVINARRITVLLWVYYSAFIFLLGAEFTKGYSDAYGSGVVPDENAEISSRASKPERSSETPEKRIA